MDVARLDVWAADWAITELSDSATADAVAREARELANRRAELEAEIASCEETATLMADRLGRGELSVARYDAFGAPCSMRGLRSSARRLMSLARASRCRGITYILRVTRPGCCCSTSGIMADRWSGVRS